METSWNTALWRQFGAAIDTLENVLAVCPDDLWRQRVWSAPTDPAHPPETAEFWYIAYHTLLWLDLYLSGSREEVFAPSTPFIFTERDFVWVLPEQPYTKEELHAYLASLRRQCHNTLVALTDEHARQPCEYPWAKGQAISYLELQLYSMRHVQEHAAHLSLFLGQHGIPDEALNWVTRAKDNLDSD